MATMTSAQHFDPRDADVIQNPFPALAQLREHQPLHYSQAMAGWVITRYEDVRNSMRDPRYSSNRLRPFFAHMDPTRRQRLAALEKNLSLWAVFNDPPDHGRVRNLMNKAFTTSALAHMEGRIAEMVESLADELVSQDGEVDFIRAFAYPLPAMVIAEILGVPQQDVAHLKRWSDELAAFVLTSRLAPDRYDRADAAIREMHDYFGQMAKRLRRAPDGGIVARMVAAEEKGDFLSEDELVAACVLLLFAGHETTTQLFGNGLYALLRWPEQMQRLRQGLDDRAQVENAVEEILRWDGPGLAGVRVLNEDVELHGQRVPAGSRIFQFVAAANRDPTVFADPDRFDISRDPNPHLTFGYGIHFCLGAPLARMEARIGWPILLKKLRHIELVETPQFSDSMIVRGLEGLRVRCRSA
ncbi:MAG: cytochrome P450 [Panacagrimonas sp.]